MRDELDGKSGSSSSMNEYARRERGALASTTARNMLPTFSL